MDKGRSDQKARRRNEDGARYPPMLFPTHPKDTRVLLRFLESEAASSDRIQVMASSLLLIGAVSWVPVFSIWAYRRWKQAQTKRRKAMYAACLVAALSLVFTPFGSRRLGDWLGVKKWPLWKSWLRYMAVEVIADQRGNPRPEAPPTDSAIVAVFSHGIFPFSLALAALPQIMSDAAFGTIRPVVATATKYFPLVNVVLSWLGKMYVRIRHILYIKLKHCFVNSDASRSSVDRALVRGDRIGLIPGGIAEIFEGYPKPGTHPDTEYAIVRRGFLKMAVQHSVPIVPVYCFGSTKLFRRLELGILKQLSSLLKASVVVFYGICGLPIPFRQKLSYVIGNPITPRNDIAAQKAVDEMYDALCDELQRLFERHKDAYGWPRKSLELIKR